MESIRLPFLINRLYGGIAKLDGIASLNPEHLTLEYRMSDSFIGAITGGVKTRTIAWTEIERAECGLGFFSPWLTLGARTLTTFDNLPCPSPMLLRLRIPWRHRRQLRALTSEINLQLSYQDADRYQRHLSGRQA
jgi:hypothetical protein